MIRISQIDTDLSIYKNNKVVLYVKDDINQDFFQLIKYHKINVEYICDTNKGYWGGFMKDIPVISPKHLKFMAEISYKEHNKCDFVVQIATNNINHFIVEEITTLGIGIL